MIAEEYTKKLEEMLKNAYEIIHSYEYMVKQYEEEIKNLSALIIKNK